MPGRLHRQASGDHQYFTQGALFVAGEEHTRYARIGGNARQFLANWRQMRAFIQSTKLLQVGNRISNRFG